MLFLIVASGNILTLRVAFEQPSGACNINVFILSKLVSDLT